MTSAATAPPAAADLETLAAWASGFELSDLPRDLLPTLRGCLLYGLAVGIATLRVPVTCQICMMLDAEGAPAGAQAVRLLDGRPATVAGAALANGVLLSGRVQGDSHPCGHLGGVVIPTALAVAQHARLSGAELLASLVVGYETGLRIGRDHSRDLSRNGFRTTPAYGVFGAAAATARGLGSDVTETRNALSLAANLVSGLREYVNAGTDESPFQAGFAARNGVGAALLARTGVRAAETALHGDAGFYTDYGGADSDHGSRLVYALGSNFEFPAVTFKPYPACQILRGMIRGIMELREQVAGAPAAAIEVRLCPGEADFIGVRYAGPFQAASQTTMSAPFCAALAWATGGVDFQGLRTYDDVRVLALVPRIRIVADERLHPYQTHLWVQLEDGRTLSSERGDGSEAYRASWESAVDATRRFCAEAGASPAHAETLIEAAAGIDEASDVSSLIDAARDAIAAA
jgi:2-methylcitrate dehydratase PrpD